MINVGHRTNEIEIVVKKDRCGMPRPYLIIADC